MFQIMINGTVFNIGQPLPPIIYHCSIIYPPFVRIQVPKDQLLLIKQWFNQLITNCTCEYIFFNDIYYRVDELNKFEDL